MNYGLALAGGGTRGAAHIGVLKALAEERLLPSSISGTSAGSIAAGLFASGMSISDMCNTVTYLSRHGLAYLDPDYAGIAKLLPQLLLKRKVSLTGLIKGKRLTDYLCELTGGMSIKDTKLKTVIPAVDINSGNTIVFTNSSITRPFEHILWEKNARLCDIMMASSSVPAVFRPKTMDNFTLVDGGVTNNLPVDLLTLAGEKRVIAVDISERYEGIQNSSIFDVVSHSFSIMSRDLKECISSKEILLLKPPLKQEAGLLTFEYMADCMEAGYLYTRKMMPDIKEVLLRRQK